MTTLTGIQARYSGDAGYLAGSPYISPELFPWSVSVPSALLDKLATKRRLLRLSQICLLLRPTTQKDKRPLRPKPITILTSPCRRRLLYTGFFEPGV
jgi:hypothetical protein